ncbi:hypothetical protein, partial [Shewanella sp.]|uniref:hypothetical protein n=1 Tax=Shewanella sp. TaxID=50422 RepID=UPI004047BE88
ATNSIPYISGVSMSGIKKYAGRSLRGRRSAPSVQAVKNVVAVKSLKTQVRNIQKNLHSNTGYLTHKQRDVARLSTYLNECNHMSMSPITLTTMEQALTAVPYFEGGLLTNVDLTNDSFQRKVRFSSISSTIHIRNNRITPCEVRVYVYAVKTDSNDTPVDLYTTGLADQMIATTPNHPMLYLSDVEQVKAMWTLVKTKKTTLNSGAQFKYSHGVKDIMYDTSMSDTYTTPYQKQFKSFCFVIRIEGVPAHQNNVSDSVGSCDSKVCILLDTIKKIEYDSGSNGTKRIITVNNSSSMDDPVIAQTTKRLQNSAGIEGY